MGGGVRMLTVGEFRAQFGEEAQCAEQLSRQRWPEGFRCPRCGGGTRGYIASRQVYECKQCGYQCSVTAGTIFHKTRTPLTGWFWAIYRMSHDKKGISAVQLMKEIGVSYTTAWLMRHKIRKAMEDRDHRYKLHGIIEMAALSPTLGAAIAISTGRASSTPRPRSQVSKNLPTRCFPGSTSRSRT